MPFSFNDKWSPSPQAQAMRHGSVVEGGQRMEIVPEDSEQVAGEREGDEHAQREAATRDLAPVKAEDLASRGHERELLDEEPSLVQWAGAASALSNRGAA